MTNITKNIYLHGVESIIQYKIGKNIFTVIGEQHASGRTLCKLQPATTIEDFLATRLKKPQNKLLIEFPPQKDISTVTCNSINMCLVRDAIVKEESISGGILQKVEGVDVRDFYIDRKLLYYIAPDISWKDFLEDIISPAYKHASELFSLNPEDYNVRDAEYLMNYANSKTNNLRFFNEMIMPYLKKIPDAWNKKLSEIDLEVAPKITILEFFRRFWGDTVDFAILKKVLKGDKNYFVFIGEEHANNFFQIFGDCHVFKTFIKNNCVDLKGMFLI